MMDVRRLWKSAAFMLVITGAPVCSSNAFLAIPATSLPLLATLRLSSKPAGWTAAEISFVEVYILREWKKAQDELKSFLGDEYQDFDLVVALPNGRPRENRIIEKEFSLLKEKAGLPNVDFHFLRHSSTTYKLKLNHGDLKVTQGDTGHAEIDMITKVYAHILDEDRKINAQKFESAFYANPDLRNAKPPQEPEKPQAQTLDLAALVEQLQKSPELANTLAALLSAQRAG